MQSAKVGRNDPCPCGSGKKFKKCCGELQDFLEPNADPFTRMGNLMTGVKVKLDQFYDREIKRARRELQKHFLRFTLEGNLPRDHESLFSDWLWFDQLDDDGDTLAYLYLKSNGNYMETPLKDALAAMNLSYLSVYEVVSSDGLILELRDIFLDRKCEVILKEPWQPDNQDLSVLLMGRVVRMADGNVFSGMVLMLQEDDEQKEFMIEHLQHAGELQEDTIVNLLKFKGEIVYGLFDHAYKKTHVTLNHMEAAIIDAAAKEKLLQSLSASYNLLHAAAGFQWLAPAASKDGYNRIAVSDQYIVTSHEVLQDLNEWKQLRQKLLTDQDFVVLSDRFLTNPPPPDLAKLWFTMVKDRECEAWLATPHAELDGKTPSEVLDEENGRQRLNKMLDEMSTRMENEEARELLDYMRIRI